ncbi:hypothetical protein [uncultured Croceitalea sp.]|uniref:hypothetical protein n=1 Tax=uncultured Croceitalea sp. TaxID=1798908 RepID=UPI0033057AF7
MTRLILLLAVLFFQSCSNDIEIVITREYIDNGYWDEYNNAIHVEKMKVKNGGVLDVLSIEFDKEIRSNWDLNDKLEVDSTFYFGYNGLNVKKDKKKLKNKIFFNRDNGFEWYSNKVSKSKIGLLQNNTWYKFSRLRPIAYYVYIYIDDTGEAHRYNVNMSNY